MKVGQAASTCLLMLCTLWGSAAQRTPRAARRAAASLKEYDEIWSDGTDAPESASSFVEMGEIWGAVVGRIIGAMQRAKLSHKHHYTSYAVSSIGLTMGNGRVFDLAEFATEHENVRKQADITTGFMLEAETTMSRTIAMETEVRAALNVEMEKGKNLNDQTSELRGRVDSEHVNSAYWGTKSVELTERDIEVRKDAGATIDAATATMNFMLEAMDDKNRLHLNTTTQREAQEVQVGELAAVIASRDRVVTSQNLLRTLQEQASSDMGEFIKGMKKLEEENKAAELNLKAADAANEAVRKEELDIEKVIDHALYNVDSPSYNFIGLDAAPSDLPAT